MECHWWASERAELLTWKKTLGLQGGIAFWPPLDAWSRIEFGSGWSRIPVCLIYIGRTPGLANFLVEIGLIIDIYDILMVMVLGVPDFYHGNLSFKSSGTSISLNSFISRPLERFGPRGLWRYALDFLHNYLGYRRLVWKHFWGKTWNRNLSDLIGKTDGKSHRGKNHPFWGVGIFTKVIAKMVVFGPVWVRGPET